MKYYILLFISILSLIISAAALPTYQQPTVKMLPTEVVEIPEKPIVEPFYIIERCQELTTEAPTEPEQPDRYTPSAWERKLLAALAEQEDSTCVESMMGVVEVVLNRIDSTHHTWAGCVTAEDVIYQAGWCNGVWVEQYQGADRLTSAEPSNTAFEAVDRVCGGEQLVGEDALFHAERNVPASRIANDIEVVKEIGSTKFWRMK